MSGDSNKDSTNELILEQGRRIRALHEIISRPDLSFDEQIDEALRLGCSLLGTEVGKVGKQDPDNNISEFLNTVVLSDLPAKRGVKIPLDKTYCNITFSSPDTIAFNDVEHSPYRDHPAVEFLGIHTYIGCTINVHGEKFGTVNFSNRTPRKAPFTEADKDLVNLIASWISLMMERNFEAEQLRKSKEAAERANQAKSIFLANTSHELRTPLTAIIGFAELALDNDQTADQRVSALETIFSSGKHLLGLINDILDLSKIEAGELDIESNEVEIIPIVEEVISIVEDHAHRKNLTLSIKTAYPIPKIIHTDALRLKQVLLNLCSNAVKFTEHGSITFHIKYEQQKHILNFEIEDTGIGLKEDQIEKVFRPFKQADTHTSRQYGGTGLGLSLSKQITELLGGSLTAESTYGKGSTFIVTLQLSSDDNASLIHSDSELRTEIENNNKPIIPTLEGRILVIDDNDLIQLLVHRFLSKTGAKVDRADNGETGVSMAIRNTYNLIFMDVEMPVMNGIETLTALRNKGVTTPVAMLTANASNEDRDECERAGCNDFVTKPIIKEKLYETASRYLKETDNQT